jgi:hypothetical protein
MDKRLTFFISVFLINAIPAMLVLSAGTTNKTLLPDGLILRDVEGRLVRQDSNDLRLRRGKLAPVKTGVWFFEFDSAITDSKGRVSAEMRLELLPSSALEQMTADANDGSAAGYRLWARVTKYKGRNFIFPIDFLPLSKSEPLDSLTSPQTEEKARLTVDEPNDELGIGIPKEILEKLKTRRTSPLVGREQSERQRKIKQNFVLTNRTGFLAKCTDGNMVFNFDALGRSIQKISLRLLPCQALEIAEQRQSAEADPIRFKIAGIVTEYKGEKFLLLHRATRTCSHGNFGR